METLFFINKYSTDVTRHVLPTWQEQKLQDLEEQHFYEQQVIDAAIKEMEQDRQDAFIDHQIYQAQQGYAEYLNNNDRQVHDFVNSPEGRAQEEQYWEDLENGWRQTYASITEISRKVKLLQKQANDLAALIEEITEF